MTALRERHRPGDPGGNFTQPDVDPATGVTVFQVYVGWERRDEEFDTWAEAEAELLNSVGGRITVVGDGHDVVDLVDAEIQDEIARAARTAA